MKRILFHRYLILPTIILTMVLGGQSAFAENIDPDNDNSQYAYGENVGWINLEPDGDSGPGVEVSDTQLTGYMWGENIGWINVSPIGAGVTNDGNGKLSGYAWAENCGWVSFACENTGSCGTVNYGVEIDPDTGLFSGYAWAENVGWIYFAPGGVPVKTSWRKSTGSCTASATAPTLGASHVYGASDLGKHLAYFLLPIGVVIGMGMWRRKR